MRTLKYPLMLKLRVKQISMVMDQNVNSNGSVIPTTTAVNVAGISNAATFLRFL